MCAPLVVMAVAVAASAAASAYSSYQQGKAASAASSYQAQQGDLNAQLAEQRIAGARFEGESRGDQIRRDGERLKAEGRTSFAGGNVDLSSGTPKFWELDVAKGVATDVAMNKYNTEQAAVGLQTDAWNYRTDAGLRRMEARNARRAGNLGAATSLLAGASQVASSYYARR